MKTTPFAVGIISAGMMMVLGAGVVSGQNYPNKPIRIVTSEVGSGSDFSARIIAQGLSGNLGQQAVVDNRPAGVIPGETVAKALPDGYTLLILGDTLWTAPLLQKTPYDPVRDFAPITLISKAPSFLVVHPAMPVKSVQELVALAKAKPGALNYASGSTGSSNHIAAELFKAMAGINVVRVPFKGSASGLTALIGGEVQLSFPNAAAAMPHIKSGRLRALAVTTAEPSALAPGLPTMSASGLPGFESGARFALFSPAQTPVTLINRLNQETARVLNSADVKEKFFNTGAEAVASSPKDLAAMMKSDIAVWGKVIKDGGIRAE